MSIGLLSTVSMLGTDRYSGLPPRAVCVDSATAIGQRYLLGATRLVISGTPELEISCRDQGNLTRISIRNRSCGRYAARFNRSTSVSS